MELHLIFHDDVSCVKTLNALGGYSLSSVSLVLILVIFSLPNICNSAKFNVPAKTIYDSLLTIKPIYK